VIAEIGDDPKLAAEGFDVGLQSSELCVAEVAFLDLRDPRLGNAHQDRQLGLAGHVLASDLDESVRPNLFLHRLPSLGDGLLVDPRCGFRPYVTPISSHVSHLLSF